MTNQSWSLNWYRDFNGQIAGSISSAGATLSFSNVERVSFTNGTYNLSQSAPGVFNHIGNEGTPAVSLDLTLPNFSTYRVASIAGTDGDNEITGSQFEDVLYGLDGNDVIFGLDLSDMIQGNAGADQLDGGGGDDTVDGGQGIDTAVFNGNRNNYFVSYNAGTQTFTVTDLRAGTPDGTDTLTGVENFQFADGVVASSTFELPAVNATVNDFNGDGKTDILWRNDAGAASIWMMDNGNVLSGNPLGIVPTDWKIAGIGDFNGDHKADILWRSDNGAASIWTMDNGHVLSGNPLGIVPTDWKIAGTDDFNGDGKADILWRGDNGAASIWLMDNGHVLSGNSLGVVPTDWKIAGTGDFNGDHKADILWRSDSGQTSVWDMDGGHVLSGNPLGVVPTDWHIT